MNAAAAAAADFGKTSFGSQFNGLMQPFSDELYSTYSYNNWASKVPSPLGAKTFPWSVNPLTSINHHQSTVNCFNGGGGMSGGGAGSMSGSSPAGVSSPCPYGTPTPPYMYHPRAAPEGACSSLATLRLKAKQHGINSPPGPALSACQYAPPL